jgi:hypothetical protein
LSNQAGWKCDICRRSGLEKKRGCGWLPRGERKQVAPVWARKHIALETCPKSTITAESQSLVEEFLVRRRLRALGWEGLSARQVEAFVILEKALAAEMEDGQHNTRHTL